MQRLNARHRTGLRRLIGTRKHDLAAGAAGAHNRGVRAPQRTTPTCCASGSISGSSPHQRRWTFAGGFHRCLASPWRPNGTAPACLLSRDIRTCFGVAEFVLSSESGLRGHSTAFTRARSASECVASVAAPKVGERQPSVFGHEFVEQVSLGGGRIVVRLPSDQKILVIGQLPDVAPAPVPDGLAGSVAAVFVESLCDSASPGWAYRRATDVDQLLIRNPGGGEGFGSYRRVPPLESASKTAGQKDRCVVRLAQHDVYAASTAHRGRWQISEGYEALEASIGKVRLCKTPTHRRRPPVRPRQPRTRRERQRDPRRSRGR